MQKRENSQQKLESLSQRGQEIEYKVAASQRSDGSWRQQRQVKPGYVPIEEKPKYKPPSLKRQRVSYPTLPKTKYAKYSYKKTTDSSSKKPVVYVKKSSDQQVKQDEQQESESKQEEDEETKKVRSKKSIQHIKYQSKKKVKWVKKQQADEVEKPSIVNSQPPIKKVKYRLKKSEEQGISKQSQDGKGSE